MASASVIRTQLLHTLDNSVIPAVESTDGLRMILGELPVHLPEGVQATHLSMPLLPDSGPEVPNFGQRWPDVRVGNFHYRTCWFVCEGEVDLRMGVTESMARAIKPDQESEWSRSGCHILHLPASTFVQLPAGVPYSDGSGLHWERTGSPPAATKILWVRLLPTGAMCHLCSTKKTRHESAHPLLINDSSLLSCMLMIEQELQMRTLHYQTIAKNLLLSLFFRIRRRLALDEPEIANTVFLPEPELTYLNPGEETSSHAQQIVKEADEFIQTHLREPITLAQTAEYCRVSTTHLNRTFNAVTGVSVMRYVYRRRILAAQKLLMNSDLPIKEIAHLMGFSQTSHFCQVFYKLQHTSPAKYREQIRSAQHSPLPGCAQSSSDKNQT